MDVDVEILNLLSKLGHREFVNDHTEVFVPDRNPVKTLKAIRRLLNKDAKEDEDFGLESLSEVRAVQKHLIPLMLAVFDEEQAEEVTDEVTKLLVLVTLPNNRWTEAFANEVRMTIIEESKVNRSPLALIVARIEGALGTDASKRSEDDRKRVDLLLFLIRNLLYPSSKEVARNEFILELQRESILDIILHFTTHIGRKNNREWDLLLLEIFFSLFRGVLPEDLISTTSLHVEKKISGIQPLKKDLDQAVQELLYTKRNRYKNLPARHSHFGGLLQVGNEGKQTLIPAIFGCKDPRRMIDPALPKSIAQRKRRVQDSSVVSHDILSSRMRNVNVELLMCLKLVADELVDKSYAALFSTIIQDFRREDARIKPEDEVRFIWMVRFFTRYSRLRKNWFKTSVMTTMDLWSFQFVVNRVIEHLEQKSWASLETSTGALLEMMSNLREINAENDGKSLKNAVFYELRERLEIIPKLLKIWDPASTSRSHLKNLVILGDLVLDTLEDMAEEGAMAKARSKALKRADRKQGGVFNLSWSAEETHALAEGVKARGGEYDLNIMRSILKDSTLAPVFEDQKRTPQQLLARWIQVREALFRGKTLEQFVKEDMAKQEEQEDEEQQQEENGKKEGEASLDREQETLEKQVDFISSLRSYLSNSVYRNLSRLIDPACHPDGEGMVLRDVESHRLVAKFFRRLRGFEKGLRSGDSLEPILWHVEIFDYWRRFLEGIDTCVPGKIAEETKELVKVVQSSLRRFFRHSQRNKLIFMEILFWRTKQDNVAISRFYNNHNSNNNKPGGERKMIESSFEQAIMKEDEEELAELDHGDTDAMDDDDMDDDDHNHNTEPHEAKMSKINSKVVAKTAFQLNVLRDESKLKKASRSKSFKKSKRTPSTKIRSKRKDTLTTHFVLNRTLLNKSVSLALQAGVTSEAFLCLVRAFEHPYEFNLVDIPFLPVQLDSADQSFDSNAMFRVMLCLGMRPPNRDLTAKTRNKFSCETYWRIPASRMTAADAVACAEALRDAIVGLNEPHDDDGDSNVQLSDVDWCNSEEDERDGEGQEDSKNENSDGEQDSTNEQLYENNGDDFPTEVYSSQDSQTEQSPIKKPKKSRLRRILSSDEEDDNFNNSEDSSDDTGKGSADPKLAYEHVEETRKEAISSQKRRRIVSDDEG